LLAGLPAPGDAPYQLADDDDLDAERARFDAMPQGPARDLLRRRLAAEYASRIDDSLARKRWDAAYSAFQRMVGLWSARELAASGPKELARHLPSILRLRSTFARAGADHQSCGTLYVLSAIDSPRAKGYIDEIEEIFAYSDHLNVAEFGNGAERARPIEILEGVAAFFPTPTVIDRLIALYLARQKAIDARIRASGADFNLIRAHGAGVLRTTWYVTGILAKAKRLREAPAVVAKIGGIGDDPDLRRLLTRALAPAAKDEDWVVLSRYFRSEDEDKSDLEAQLAILEAGLAIHPQSARLNIEAGNTAVELDRVPMAVRFFERGLATSTSDRNSSERLAALYEGQVITLALGARVKAATETLARFEAFHERAESHFDRPLKPDLADAYAAMGQGLVSLGDLDRARRYLRQSVRQRPTFSALEVLGTIELKRGHFGDAGSYFRRALQVPIENDRQHFRFNKLLRLAGEAAAGTGDQKRARRYFEGAMDRWQGVLAKYDLSSDLLAELLIETGKVQWAMKDPDSAIEAFDAAVDAAPESELVAAEVVAFYVGHDRYRDALDVYHRALESQQMSDEIKVYMSLWMIAEARLDGTTPDPFATDFIAKRSSDLWQDQLARYADGRLSMEEIKKLATTRRRQSELLFYGAVLHEAGRDKERAADLLRRVEAGNMILDFEYDLARRWLEHGL